MNIQYHFSVLVFLIVLERSYLDCYTTIDWPEPVPDPFGVRGVVVSVRVDAVEADSEPAVTPARTAAPGFKVLRQYLGKDPCCSAVSHSLNTYMVTAGQIGRAHV